MSTRLLNVAETSALLGKHPEVVRRLAKQGRLPGAKIGRSWYFSEAALIRYVEGRPLSEKGRQEETDWAAMGLAALAREYGPEDEGLYDDPDALGYERIRL